MWGQEKQEAKRSGDGAEEGAAPAAATPDGTDDIIAFVGKGVQFKGVISYSGTVRIDGNLDGEIHTDGVLLIGDEAVIQAKVTAGTIVCKGKVTGDIAAKERVKLRAPAVFNGNMKTPMLSIEDGVLFNGGLEMTQGVPDAVALHPVPMTGSPVVKRASGE
jgi:cytoskeletal protein CcmA (bactofilin family)